MIMIAQCPGTYLPIYMLPVIIPGHSFEVKKNYHEMKKKLYNIWILVQQNFGKY